MPSKAERVRYLLEAGLSNAMIAEHVGCREEYVRVVKQRLCPRRIAQDQAYKRALQATGDKRLARRSWGIHYHDARGKGLPVRQALEAARTAYQKAIAATADLSAARAAYHAAKRGTSHA